MATFESWPVPCPFIETNDDGKLIVNSQTAALLEKIMHPVVVVAIAGSYRTGKSYLMNKLAGKHGFELGSELVSKTKGIWMWCIKHPLDNDKVLVLIDTEGLGDPQKLDNETHDMKIFSLALLLSSTFIFNTFGKIDQSMIEKLHFVTEITENIKVKSADADQDEIHYTEYMEYFPIFALAVRDFTLELKINGEEVTPDKYFDFVLQLKQGDSFKTLNYNQPRSAILNAFRSHHCFVFTWPVKDERLFPSLATLPEDELSPMFLTQAEDFCSFIFKNSTVKKIQLGKEANGRVLSAMAKQYIQSINSNGVPCIESTLDYVIRSENERTEKEAIAIYKSIMENLLYPVTEKEFYAAHAEAIESAMKHFTIHSILDSDLVYSSALKDKLSEAYSRYIKKNELSSREKCDQLLWKLFSESVEPYIKNGNFAVPGGYKLYERAMDQLLKEYEGLVAGQIKAQEAKQCFLDSCENHRTVILTADESMTKKEKERENDRKQAEAMQAQLCTQKEELKRQQAETNNLKNSHDVELKKLQEEFQRREEQREKDNAALINKLLQQQQEMLEKGFHKVASDLQAEIGQLQRRSRSRGFCSLM